MGYYYYQRNVYSREVVRIEILGQEEPQAFEEIEYLVKYKNNGNLTLEDAELIFEYPDKSITGSLRQRDIIALQDIYPGEEKTVSFSAKLLGREGQVQQAQATLRYRPKNLTAFFESSTTFTSRIKSLPLTLEIDLPSRIESGKEIQFFLNYFSNLDWPVSGLRVKIEYPFGFEFVSSRPQALDKTEWDLPILNKAEGGRIEIRGKLLGDVREQKVFRATLGLWSEGDFILLKEMTKGAEILRPTLAISQQINGSSQYAANLGDVLHYEIFFKNIGIEPFQDVFLVAKLEGEAFDFDTLRTDSGQFNRGDNFIMWDWREVPRLKFLGGGEEGKLEFWVSLKQNLDISLHEKNFVLKNQIVFSQAREEFETKINSRLEISQKAYFQDEIFGSNFPLFTILWDVKNHYNDVKGAAVKAVLPTNVRLTGKIFPEEAPLTFDSQSREIVWSLGDIEAGEGVRKQAPRVAFQVALAEASQGAFEVVIGQARVSGRDDWTGIILQAADNPISGDQAR